MSHASALCGIASILRLLRYACLSPAWPRECRELCKAPRLRVLVVVLVLPQSSQASCIPTRQSCAQGSKAGQSGGLGGALHTVASCQHRAFTVEELQGVGSADFHGFDLPTTNGGVNGINTGVGAAAAAAVGQTAAAAAAAGAAAAGGSTTTAPRYESLDYEECENTVYRSDHAASASLDTLLNAGSKWLVSFLIGACGRQRGGVGWSGGHWDSATAGGWHLTHV